MSEIARVLYDLGILSILLLLGVFLRKKVRFLQNLYIPASLLGGFCGLMLGPQILGSFAPFSLPIGGTISKWPGMLVNIVLGVSFYCPSGAGCGRTYRNHHNDDVLYGPSAGIWPDSGIWLSWGPRNGQCSRSGAGSSRVG